jgi:hypothetical protein
MLFINFLYKHLFHLSSSLRRTLVRHTIIELLLLRKKIFKKIKSIILVD